MALFLLVFGMNTVKANHLLGTQITCKWVSGNLVSKDHSKVFLDLTSEKEEFNPYK
jgi:uncharacterized Zn-finger protein